MWRKRDRKRYSPVIDEKLRSWNLTPTIQMISYADGPGLSHASRLVQIISRTLIVPLKMTHEPWFILYYLVSDQEEYIPRSCLFCKKNYHHYH